MTSAFRPAAVVVVLPVLAAGHPPGTARPSCADRHLNVKCLTLWAYRDLNQSTAARTSLSETCGVMTLLVIALQHGSCLL